MQFSEQSEQPDYQNSSAASPEDQASAKLAQDVANAPVPDRRESLLDSVIDASLRKQAEAVRVQEAQFEFQQRRAKMFAMSGLFTTWNVPGPQAIAQAMVKIELGESMGFSPAESLQGIYIINGVTSIAAALRAARMKACGYDWVIDWLGTETACEGCRLWLYRGGKPMLKPVRDAAGNAVFEDNGEAMVEHVSVSYTKADAAKMMTTIKENGQKRRASILEKENWQMNPKNMYFARAITNAQRWYASEVLSINIASVEEAVDIDPAQRFERQVERARGTLNMSDFRPSEDPNRGHDRVAPDPVQVAEEMEQQEAEAATAESSESAADDPPFDPGPQQPTPTPAAARAPRVTTTRQMTAPPAKPRGGGFSF